MTAFNLQRPEGTCTFHKITSGRKWVGRVFPKADGTFGAKLGQHEATGATARAAFEQVVSQFFGKANVSELLASNARVQAERRIVKDRARHAVQQFYAGNDKPFFDMIFPKRD